MGRTPPHLIAALVISLAAQAHAECERMLGLSTAPVADLLLARPTIAELRYIAAPGGTSSDDEPCTVAADLTIDVPSSAELDWLDIVLTRQLGKDAQLASDGCAMIADGRASLRVRLIPGQPYVATVAAFDVDGRKSDPVSLELEGPGLGSREWMEIAPWCPKPPHERQPPPPSRRTTWPAAVAIAASALSMAWLLYLLAWPRTRRQ